MAVLLAIVAVAIASVSHAQEPTFLVKDINTQSEARSSGIVGDFHTLGDAIFFIGRTSSGPFGSSRYGLWRTDGTEDGTAIIKSFPSRVGPAPLHAADGSFFFGTVGETNFWTSFFRLWKSDGTSAGTVPVKEIYRGEDRRPPIFLFGQPMLTVGDTVFFVGNDGKTGFELWKTDGSEDGTALVKDIAPGPEDFFDSALVQWESVNGILFFGDPLGDALWRTDGTAAGTKPVQDLTHVFFVAGTARIQGQLLFLAGDLADRRHGGGHRSREGSRGFFVFSRATRPSGSQRLSLAQRVNGA
jgi:ELWxxDGT repeat protein